MCIFCNISETKVPPVLMENTEEEPSLPTPVKDKIQSVSEVQLPENGTESHPEPEPVSWISEEVSAIYSQVVETEKPEKETKKPTLYLLKRRRRRLIMKSSSARIFLERLVFLF